MRSTLILAALMAVFTGHVFAQTGPQESEAEIMARLSPLRTSIYGVLLVGERDLEPAIVGKTFDEGYEIFRSAMHRVRMGESFQLIVELALPGAEPRPVTSDPATKYHPNGCLLVSTSGFVTIAHTEPGCGPGDVSELWTVLLDGAQVRAWNHYVFLVVKSP